MLRSARNAALAALVCAAGLALTGLLALAFPIVRVRDSAALEGFVGLDRPRVTAGLDWVAHLADPLPYAIFGSVCVVVALLRRRPRSAIAIPIVLVGAEVMTQGLKLLLAQPRVADWLGGSQIASASWPSGHATAAMGIALCAVLAAPPRLRPGVAAVGGLFAIAVAYSILALHWHFPSDIVGGYLVALMWTLGAVAAIVWSQERFPERARPERGPNAFEARVPLVVGGAVVAVAGLVFALRPQHVGDYLVAHPTFAVGAVAIAGLAVTIAIGFQRALSDSLPAPTGVRSPPRLPRG